MNSETTTITGRREEIVKPVTSSIENITANSLASFIGQFPLIDGHFWIVRDSEIIDFDFPNEYNFMKQFHGLTDKQAYKEADKMTQQIMLSIMEKKLDQIKNYVEFLRTHKNDISFNLLICVIKSV